VNQKNVGLITAAIGIPVCVAVIFCSMWVSYTNAEVRQRNLIIAKQRENQTQLDTTLKTISQSAQVSQEQMSQIKDIIIGNSQAQKTGGGTLSLSLQYAVPNLDQASRTFTNLQNIVVAARNQWQNNQTALLDLKRVHDNMIDTMPSSWFVGTRPKIDIIVITSNKVDNAFRSGKDDDDSVFKKSSGPEAQK
jgi:hypothetical protein